MTMFASNESLMSGMSSVASSADGYSRRSSEDLDQKIDGEISEYINCNRSTSLSELEEDNQDEIDIFPSIPDEFLEEMGLLGEKNRRHQNEEEIEQKFATLSLAFSIDVKTIKDRCERQRRNRDQTEKNLLVEIDRLIENVNNLNRLCINMERTELFATLLTQIDNVSSASRLATSSAERYGSVQHEERLSDAVQLMINHVNTLKQQRDLSRKQLQYTKRVLQDTDSKESNTIKERRLIQQAQNSRVYDKRRASIAIATLDQKRPERNIIRRTSELSFRTNAIPKLPKPSRMDLGVDLVKIQEGKVDENIYDCQDDIDTENEKNSTVCDESNDENDKTDYVIKERNGLYHYIDVLQKRAENVYHLWNDQEKLSNFFYIGSVLFFCFAIVIMADVLFEMKRVKR